MKAGRTLMVKAWKSGKKIIQKAVGKETVYEVAENLVKLSP